MDQDFELTQDQIENAPIYDREKQSYINSYLLRYFESKFSLLRHPEHKICCRTDGMEHYTIEDKVSARPSGSCIGELFGDWKNNLLVHSTAKFDCKRDFQIGYCLEYKNKDLIDLLSQLREMSDKELLCGKEFNGENRLTMFTGYMMNNFSSTHSYFN